MLGVRKSKGKNSKKNNKGQNVRSVKKESFEKKSGSISGLKILPSHNLSLESLSKEGDVEDSNILEKLAALQCQKVDSNLPGNTGTSSTESLPCLQDKKSGISKSPISVEPSIDMEVMPIEPIPANLGNTNINCQSKPMESQTPDPEKV